ncbi:Sec-independent protein translocase protein TatB [Roseateles sp.]|uniref:Sec-independent protein translocase protein TatB n=1 Tax=Roseateles sp. TaxID=1971397 RepID=UPI003265A2AD
MLDFGFDKIALIGAVALIVIGPEKLPRVARTVGTLLGKAQRYVADVKAEVNRSIELEELQKMKSQFTSAVHDAERSVREEVDSATGALNQTWRDVTNDGSPTSYESIGLAPSLPEYRHPKKNWRLKRGATPLWFKQKAGVRRHSQSGAARVARFRPPGRT